MSTEAESGKAGDLFEDFLKEHTMWKYDTIRSLRPANAQLLVRATLANGTAYDGREVVHLRSKSRTKFGRE